VATPVLPKGGNLGKPRSKITAADLWRDREICVKWLNGRSGWNTTDDDLKVFRKIVRALSDALRFMAENDMAVPKWPIE